MDRDNIKELADYLIPMAESTNAAKAEMATEYDEKWEFYMGRLGAGAILNTLLAAKTLRQKERAAGRTHKSRACCS